MTDRELMQMALRFFDWFYSDDHSVGREDFKATQQALRERLAQPVHAIDTSQERVDETAKHEQEFFCPRCGHCCQQREWVGLTDEDILEARNESIKHYGDKALLFAKYIEAKLKEKNNG
jgi:hypothetical protein